MKTHTYNIFNMAGCISERAMQKYLDGQLPNSDEELLIKHLQTCEFCRIAIEGYNTSPDISFKDDLSMLKKRVSRKSTKSKNILYKYYIIAMAASLIVLFGIVGLYPYLRTDVQDKLAYNGELLSRQVVYVPADQPSVIIEEDIVIDSDSEKFYIPKIKQEKQKNIPEIESKTSRIELALETQHKPGMNIYNHKKAPKKLQKKENIEDLIIFHDQPYHYGYSYNETDRVLMNFDLENIGEVNKEFINPTFRGKNVSYFVKSLGSKIIYPDDVSQSAVNGTVYIRFTVDEYGDVIKPKIIKSLHPKLDLIAVKAILETSGWEPAFYGEEPIKTDFTIPVKFKLLD